MNRKRNLLKIVLPAFLCAVLLFSLAGCEGEIIPDINDGTESGGTTDKTDYNAPKEIKSKDITDFHTEFYLNGEWVPGTEGETYTFDVKEDGFGVLTASESTTGIRCEADDELLSALQTVIDERGLAEKNGVYNITAGLPPEFWPCNLTVNYASGENLTFTTDNNPEADWAKDTYLVFADWFSEKGDDTLQPPELDEPVARFTLSFDDDGINYRCGDWMLQNSEDPDDGSRHIIERDLYDTEKEEILADDYIPFFDGYLDDITGILGKYDIRTFDESSAFYGRGRIVTEEPERNTAALELHFEFESGHKVYIDTDAESDIEILRPLIEDLIEYHDSLF